ncbi:2-oxoglutarate dehydrogenase E1 subunit family protein, partial [Mumia xiangluensis]
MAESDSPLPDFGTNQWLVEEMYERYKTDPKSVDASWSRLFEGGGTTPASAPTAAATTKAAPAATAVKTPAAPAKPAAK